MAELIEADDKGHIIAVIDSETGVRIDVQSFFEKGPNVFEEEDLNFSSLFVKEKAES